jgi:PST family polysaccharide transporter
MEHGTLQEPKPLTLPPSTEAAPPKTDLGELKRKSVRGGLTTIASQGANTFIQLCSTVVLARLLAPADYGIMAMVTTITAFAGLFSDLGLSTAVIRKKDLTQAQQNTMFWLNVAMGLALTITVVLISPIVAWFYQKPEVLWVTVALSATFLIGSFGTQHGALLVREMQFGRLVLSNVSGALTGLVVSITLANAGYGYWSLVWGTVCTTTCSTILLNIVSPFRPGLPSRGTGVRDMLKFGAHVTAFDFVNYFARNLDNVLIGRFSGTVALGLYSRGYSLLMFPITNLRGPINAVALPAMSKLQNDPDAFRAYYRKITSVLAFLSMPLTAFFFVASTPIIELALGRQWLGVVPIFSILATVGFIQPVMTNWGVVVLSLGNSKRYLQGGMWYTLSSILGFLAGIPWGGTGVATGYAIATYLALYPILRLAFRGTPIRIRDFFQSVLTPAIASCITVVAMTLMPDFYTGQSLIFNLLSLAAVFASIYAFCFILIPGGLRTALSHLQLLQLTGRPKSGHASSSLHHPSPPKP